MRDQITITSTSLARSLEFQVEQATVSSTMPVDVFNKITGQKLDFYWRSKMKRYYFVSEVYPGVGYPLEWHGECEEQLYKANDSITIYHSKSGGNK